MTYAEKVSSFLGAPYIVKFVDNELVIARNVMNYRIEVTGVSLEPMNATIYIYSERPTRKVFNVYSGIWNLDNLKDLLGYYSAKLQMLPQTVQVQCEEKPL